MWYCFTFSREKTLHQALLVLLKGVKFLFMGLNKLIKRRKAIGYFLLFLPVIRIIYYFIF